MWSGYGQEVLMRADDAVHAPLHRGALVIDALFDDFLHLPTYTGTSQGSIISTIYVSRTHLLHSACSVPTKKNKHNKKNTHKHQQLFCERKPASPLLSNCASMRVCDLCFHGFIPECLHRHIHTETLKRKSQHCMWVLYESCNADSAKPGTGWKPGHNMMLESYLACGADAKTLSQQGDHKSFPNVYRWPKNYRKPEAALAAKAKQARKIKRKSKQ